ncbi:hypothetical protein AQUCO_11000053v1 [Aquilegia coerulea]|uniref:Cytochrome P450 n=1 Tax=Aquilegia coerulea TaxID=218851 RepID=A0A2G5C2X7_AQUCA|nr:hypothetical protein AQUCO_11000053v1 [Aquilegia coerulea]
MNSQGIKGPSYKFLHGNTKQVFNMTRNCLRSPMKLTNCIFPRVQPHLHLWTKTYGLNFLIWHGSIPQLSLNQPDLIKEVLNNGNELLYPKPEPYPYLKKLLGDGLATIRGGKKWSKKRKLVNHAFHGENLKNMMPKMVSCIENMLQRWEHLDGKEIEVLEEFRVLTSDVISKTAFGSNYIEGREIFGMLTKLMSIMAANTNKIKLPIIGKFVKSSDEREADKLALKIRESFVEIIRRRQEQIPNGELTGYGSDFLGLLVDANRDSDEDKRISVDDIIDECKTFYTAGHETTMVLLTWTMFLLAIHSDWQEKARKEVFAIFGEKPPNVEENSIAKLKTMTMIVNESLRLYPPVLVLRRITDHQVRLKDILLPPNMEIQISPLLCHSDPQFWGEDVHLFKPDRFMEGVANAAKTTNVYLPFGIGPRMCVGMNFATIEAKLALSMILKRYSFTLSPSYVHSPIQHVTTRPQHGVQIILHAL